MSHRSKKYAARHLVKAAHRAIGHHRLIEPGDGVLVAVSGGADSLSLLHILLDLQRGGALDCRLVAAHVFPGWPPETHPSALRAYFDAMGVPSVVEDRMSPEDQARITGGKDVCFHCARYRRKRLFHIAHEQGCRRVALAHHRGDVLETLLINLFERGRTAAMAPLQEFFDGQIAIVRPFYAVEERRIKAYARLFGLPLFLYKCPHGRMRREFWRAHLRLLEQQRPGASANLFRALHHLERRFLPADEDISDRL